MGVIASHDCLLNRLFRRRSKKTSKLRVTGLCEWNSPGTDEFPAQMASDAENVSISWRHHEPNNVSTLYVTMWQLREHDYARTPAATVMTIFEPLSAIMHVIGTQGAKRLTGITQTHHPGILSLAGYYIGDSVKLSHIYMT